MAKSLSITFAGGARHVTGSNFLVEARDDEKVTRILVDCGLIQGARFCESENGEPFPYTPKDIDAVFVTHAHADHIGRLPKLARDGFSKQVYTTAPTRELMPIMLEDSVELMQREARACDEEPPYEAKDVARLLGQVKTAAYHETIDVAPGVSATLYDAGHIIGSATVLIDAFGTRILFTGDLGRVPALLIPDREVPPQPIHYLVTESVYGSRTHEPIEESENTLASAVQSAAEKDGTLLIPAFSLERTQIILATLDRMMRESTVPNVPVFLDSPLAAKVTEVYRNHPDFLRENFRAELKEGGDPFSFPGFSITDSPEDSRAISRTKGAKVIIAGAGMSHGGRIRTHEKMYLPHPNTELLLVGYQVPGSLGRRLKDGANKVSIDKEKVRVQATVRSTGGFSAHADRDDLIAFAEAVAPEKAFVVLGEMEQASFLAQRLSGFLGIESVIPQKGETWDLPLK